MLCQVLAVLDRVKDLAFTTADVQSLIAESNGSALPPRQITWILLGLLHYLRRKCWAWEVFHERLRSQIKMRQMPNQAPEMRDMFATRHEQIVPGLPDWSYEINSWFSFLTNRVTGERIHVDLVKGFGFINPGYFVEYVESLHTPGPAEKRLRELFPMSRGLCTATEYLLRDVRFSRITFVEDCIDEFALRSVLRKYTDPVEAFLEAWQHTKNRFKLNAVIGEWDSVAASAELDNRPKLKKKALALASQSHRRWLNIIRTAADADLTEDALHALADAGAEDLSDYLKRAFTDPSLADTAIEIAKKDPKWRNRMYHIFKNSIHGHLKDAAAHYLAFHGHSIDELIEGLLSEPADLASAICIALDNAPEKLRHLLPLGLASKDRDVRLLSASVLTLLDCDWGTRALIDCLNKSNSLDNTIEARCALREIPAGDVGVSVTAWEAKHPEQGQPPIGSDRFWYQREGGCDVVLQDAMRAMSKSAERIRPLVAELPSDNGVGRVIPRYRQVERNLVE